MSFLLISDNDRRSATLEAPDRAMFRADALEIRMYYVPEGETILVTRGQDALLMEGGSGRALRKPALAHAIAGELRGRRLRAIVASHPHRDHTNSHSGLVGAVNFAPGALYFDNAIPAADANFQRIDNDHPALPFQRVPVLSSQQDDANRILPRFGGAGADVHVLRSSTNAQTHSGQVYWPVFVFLRLRNAWMLFTGDVITKLYETRMTPRLQDLNTRTHFLKITHTKGCRAGRRRRSASSRTTAFPRTPAATSISSRASWAQQSRSSRPVRAARRPFYVGIDCSRESRRSHTKNPVRRSRAPAASSALQATSRRPPPRWRAAWRPLPTRARRRGAG